MGAPKVCWLRLFSLLLCLSSLRCYAQFSGNIQGVVSDQTGATINAAHVLLRNQDTGIEVSAVTRDSGNYRFSSLAPGNYTVSVDASGFKTTNVNVLLSTSETKGINITMSLAAAQQTLTVEVTPPIVATDDSRIQATLSANTVRDLPQANRNLWDVLAVTPGVVGAGVRAAGTSPGGGNDNFGTQTPQLSANGRSYTGNLVMVDGLNVTSPIQNGNIILAPIPDAVQEATLQANSWDAENSLGSSILIQVTTKSGTNQFHGTGSLFFTDQSLQATPEFQTKVAPFSRKDLVGALGGPILKNRIFFFSDFEKLWSKTPEQQGSQTFEAPEFVNWSQQNLPNTVGTQVLTQYPATFLHPSGVAQTADVYFGNDPNDPQHRPLCQTNPAAVHNIPCTLPMLDKGSFVFSPYYNALQYNFRVDLYASEKDRVYLSYYNVSFDQQQPSPRAGLQALNIMRNRYGQADYTHTFRSNLLWESSFAFASVGGANGQDANLKVPDINVLQSEGYHIGGGWGPGEFRGPMYNWRSVLSWSKGKHTLKFGFDGGHGIEHGDFTPVNVRPSFNFNSLLALAQDQPQSESVGAYNPLTGKPGTVIFGGQSTPFGFFAQDDWKVKSNLSLTLALRYDDFTNHSPWGNSGFKFSSLILGSGSSFDQQVANASVRTVPSVFAHSMSNLWSPRIGIAWDPTGHGNWAVRGGIGVYHDWVVLGQSVDQMRNNPPGVVSPTFTAGSGIQPIFALAPSGTYPFNYPLPPIPAGQLDPKGGLVGVASNVDALDRDMKAPLAVNYVIGVEHQLPWKLVAGASYSGSKSYNGLTGSDVNRCAGCATLTGTGEAISRPNTSFGAITLVNNANAASYNAMILSLRRLVARASFQASYTLSRAKSYIEAGTRFDQDTGGQNFGTNLSVPDQHAYFNYYSDANWDVRNRLSFSGSYTLPGLSSGLGKALTSGWELTSIVVAQSGTPFWVIDNRPLTAGGDYNADGNNFDIPNAPAQNFTGSHSRQAYMNGLFTAASFPAPAPGTEGNLNRNIYRNPGLFQVDASVLKNTHIPWFGEQGSLQFRFDFLNLFNHVNLGGVDPYLGDGSNFGKATTALAARQLQLGLRVSF